MLCWAQVMDMNREKTGALIAAARKEKNMTQKDLAKALHVSDRAVSKWERGAGFPDVGLLEPLADALDLQVLDLLRGEEQEEAEPEVTVRRALVLLVRQTREKTRRRWGQILGTVLLLCLMGVFLPSLIYALGFGTCPVTMEVPVKIYVDGIETGESTVHIEGERQFLFEKAYRGRFSIECVEATCLEEAKAFIFWDVLEDGGESIDYGSPGSGLDCGVEHWLYITEDMESFGLRLENGTIIATNESYVPLLTMDCYYPIDPPMSFGHWSVPME